MNGVDVLFHVRRAGGDIVVENGGLTIRAPRGVISADHLAVLAHDKPKLLQLLSPPPDDAAVPDPAGSQGPFVPPKWWSPNLSDQQNRWIDEFMSYRSTDALTDAELDSEIAVADVAPCGNCGSLWIWWDGEANPHCRTCDPPLTAMRLMRIRDALRLRYRPATPLRDAPS